MAYSVPVEDADGNALKDVNGLPVVRWIGVLNDFDLASFEAQLCASAAERTGTLPYMALELLTPHAQRGGVRHLYRHDLESFFWVLVWICFKNGEEKQKHTFYEWRDNTMCYEKKLAIFNEKKVLSGGVPARPTDQYSKLWQAVGVKWFFHLDEKRDAMSSMLRRQALEQSIPDEEDENDEGEGQTLVTAPLATAQQGAEQTHDANKASIGTPIAAEDSTRVLNELLAALGKRIPRVQQGTRNKVTETYVVRA